MATRKILAVLTIEDVDYENEYDQRDPDATRRYQITGGWQTEGELYISSRPSRLEDLLKRCFFVDDPFMVKTNGIVPTSNAYTPPPATRTFYNSPSSPTVSVPQKGKNGEIRRVFLTRDPIYKEPEGSVSNLIQDISKNVLGKDGDAIGLMGDLLDEIISPRRRT